MLVPIYLECFPQKQNHEVRNICLIEHNFPVKIAKINSRKKKHSFPVGRICSCKANKIAHPQNQIAAKS